MPAAAGAEAFNAAKRIKLLPVIFAGAVDSITVRFATIVVFLKLYEPRPEKNKV